MKIGVSVRRMFFDRALVEGKIDRQTYLVMSRFGAFVRRTARQNFRRGTANFPVPPKPRNISGFLRDHPQFGIQFFWDSIARTLVVGPAIFPNPKYPDSPKPMRVERGGVFTISKGRTKSGPKTYQARYREFPFMRDALAKELPGLPVLWQTVFAR